MKLLLSVIGLALTTLRENKIRSFLTVLGVIIGTGTIIAVGSILAAVIVVAGRWPINQVLLIYNCY